MNKFIILLLLIVILVTGGCSFNDIQSDRTVLSVNEIPVNSLNSNASSDVVLNLSESTTSDHETVWTKEEEEKLKKAIKPYTEYAFDRVLDKKEFPSPDENNAIIYYSILLNDDKYQPDEERYNIEVEVFCLNDFERIICFRDWYWQIIGEDAIWIDDETVFLTDPSNCFFYDIRTGEKKKLPEFEFSEGSFVTNVLIDKDRINLYINCVSWVCNFHSVYQYDIRTGKYELLYKYPFEELIWDYIPVIRWESENIFSFLPSGPKRLYYRLSFEENVVSGYLMDETAYFEYVTRMKK